MQKMKIGFFETPVAQIFDFSYKEESENIALLIILCCV